MEFFTILSIREDRLSLRTRIFDKEQIFEFRLLKHEGKEYSEKIDTEYLKTNTLYFSGLVSLRIVREYLDSHSDGNQKLSNDHIFVILDNVQSSLDERFLLDFSEELKKNLSLFLNKEVHLFLSFKDFEVSQTKRYEQLSRQEHKIQLVSSSQNKMMDKEKQKAIALVRPRNALLLDIGDVLTEKAKTADSIEFEKIDDGVINILIALIENGIPIGFATGKPLSEVDRIFNKYKKDEKPSIADSAYVYSTGGTIVRLPCSLGGNIIINPLSEQTKLAINDMLKQLGAFGLDRARVYKQKSDLRTYTEDRRDYELYDGLPTRINITSLCGDDPANPNCVRFDGTDSRFESAFILQNILDSYSRQDKRVSCIFRVAGRIGLDVSAVGKGWANQHFTQELVSKTSPIAERFLAEKERELGIDCKGRILKIIDLYSLGKGADSDFIDSYSFSIGENDRCYESDMDAPVMFGGGIKSTLDLLEKTIWVSPINGKAFKVDRAGNIIELLILQRREMLSTLWNRFQQSEFKGHIADIDGNLTPLDESCENVCNEVITSIKEKLIQGIPFGICSARSIRPGLIIENIRNSVIEGLPDEALQHFFLFPEQGSKVVWYERKNDELISHEINLAKFFKVVPQSINKITVEEREFVFQTLAKTLEQKYGYPVIKIKSEKDYGFQASVIKQEDMEDDFYAKYVKTITREVNDILKSSGIDFEGFCTRSAVFVAKKNVNKELPLRFISYVYGIPKEQIVGTDDQCDETGVGYSLTKHFGGVSTAYGDDKSTTQLNIAEISGKTGVDAWLFLDKHIKYKVPTKVVDCTELVSRDIFV
ncbi:MAG TPA: hypothetical protein VLL98_02205 [Rickettsiales bacterium]|nr:hypothetical protein [Rickettsiales bacterium]